MKLRIIPKILLAFSLPFFLFACSEKKTLTRLDLPDNLTYFRYIFDTPIAYSKKMSIDQNFVCDGEVFNFDVTYSYNVQTLLIAVEIIDKANLEMATMYGPLLLRNAVDEQLIAKTTYVGIEGEYSVTFDDRGDHSATTNIDFNSYATSTSTQAQQSFPNIFSYVDTNIDLDNFAYLQGYTWPDSWSAHYGSDNTTLSLKITSTSGDDFYLVDYFSIQVNDNHSISLFLNSEIKIFNTGTYSDGNFNDGFVAYQKGRHQWYDRDNYATTFSDSWNNNANPVVISTGTSVDNVT